MTIKEIISGLKFTVDMFLFDPNTGETYTEPRNNMDKTTVDACKGAIELLEQTRWVPVSERLPKKNGNYIVSLEDAVDTYARFFNGKWFMPLFGSIAREYGEYEVIAWMPLPKPYKGGEEND